MGGDGKKTRKGKTQNEDGQGENAWISKGWDAGTPRAESNKGKLV